MVPISPEIYSGAAVVMDNRSLFDYIQKIEDRRLKQRLAEQEAVDNYLEDVNKKLTPTGMRAQDVPNFLKMQNDFRQLSNQYKSTKDPLKRLELQKKGDEMFLYIQKSKQADELAKPTREALKNPANREKLNTEKMMQDLAIHDMPLGFQGVNFLGIPARRDINPNASYYKETPFSFKENFDKAATGPGIKFSELSITLDGKTNKISEGFNKPTIKSIASNFVDIVDADEDKKSYYAIRAKNPQIYPAPKLAAYDKKVKEYFPKITVDDSDWRSIALAEAILEAENRNAEKFENAPKISVSTGGAAAGPPLDYYKQLVSAWKPYKVETQPYTFAGREGLPLNKIKNVELQSLLIKKAKELRPDDSFSQENLYLKRFPDYSIHLINITRSKDIDLGEISEADVNIPLQPSSAARVQAGKSAEFPEMKSEKKENVINLSDVPTGAKLTQKGNDYFYQGKKVIQ